MPTYEMACVLARAVKPSDVARIVQKSVEQLTYRGAVMRSVESLGAEELPFKMRSWSREWHTSGRRMLMKFDANPRTMLGLFTMLRGEQQMIRHTVIKLPEAYKIERPADKRFQNCRNKLKGSWLSDTETKNIIMRPKTGFHSSSRGSPLSSFTQSPAPSASAPAQEQASVL